ncbi:MAG: glycosyltransferase [Proteobacteria bacterium]|nr:glycosyltransferase [Pseudomonadota bacterium]
MKILILSSVFSPNIFGGGEVVAYNMAKLLVRRGHDVSVATSLEENESHTWGERTKEGYKLYRIPIQRNHTTFGRTKNSIPSWKKIIWHGQDYFDSYNAKIISKLLKDVNPDHVDIHSIIGIGFNILSEINKCNVSVVYFLHDLNLACFHGPMFKNGQNCKKQCKPCQLTGYLRQRELQKVSKLGFISPSQTNLNNIIPFASVVKDSPHKVVRNVPDDLPNLPKRESSKELRLIYVGRLEAIKGINFLLETLSQLDNKDNFHLTILGTGSLEEVLRTKYEANSWVTFKGFVKQSDVPIAISQSDLFCMSSLWSETYGLVTAQALQIGIPVIGSNIGGTTELVRNNETGLLLPPGDKKAWGDAFQMILEQPDILDKWRINTEIHKEEFDANKLGAEYEEFIATLN